MLPAYVDAGDRKVVCVAVVSRITENDIRSDRLVVHVRAAARGPLPIEHQIGHEGRRHGFAERVIPLRSVHREPNIHIDRPGIAAVVPPELVSAVRIDILLAGAGYLRHGHSFGRINIRRYGRGCPDVLSVIALDSIFDLDVVEFVPQIDVGDLNLRNLLDIAGRGLRVGRGVDRVHSSVLIGAGALHVIVEVEMRGFRSVRRCDIQDIVILECQNLVVPLSCRPRRTRDRAGTGAVPDSSLGAGDFLIGVAAAAQRLHDHPAHLDSVKRDVIGVAVVLGISEFDRVADSLVDD